MKIYKVNISRLISAIKMALFFMLYEWNFSSLSSILCVYLLMMNIINDRKHKEGRIIIKSEWFNEMRKIYGIKFIFMKQ